MSVAFGVDIRQLTVAPGVRETIYGVGNTFTVLTADVAGNTDPDFRIGLSDQSPVRFGRGLRYRMPEGETFDRLTIENPPGAAASLNITVMIALGDVSDGRSQLVGTVVANIGTMPAVTIAAGQTVNIGNTPAVTISGTPTVNVGTTGGLGFNDGSDATVTGTPALLWSTQVGTGRRLLIAQNIGWNDARIGSTNLISGSRGLLLRPGETATIETWFQIYGMAVSGTTTLTRSMSIY